MITLDMGMSLMSANLRFVYLSVQHVFFRLEFVIGDYISYITKCISGKDSLRDGGKITRARSTPAIFPGIYTTRTLNEDTVPVRRCVCAALDPRYEISKREVDGSPQSGNEQFPSLPHVQVPDCKRLEASLR